MAQQNPFSVNTFRFYYWKPSDELWGHSSLQLGDNTHISWWPQSEPGEGKKHPGLVPVGIITEWIDAYPNQTLRDDCQFEGRNPTGVMQFPPTQALDQRAIKQWWLQFKQKAKYNAIRLNCSTVVYLALKAGGATNLVPDPGNWWWAPDRALDYALAVHTSIIKQQRGQIRFDDSQAPRVVLQGKAKADENKQKLKGGKKK